MKKCAVSLFSREDFDREAYTAYSAPNKKIVHYELLICCTQINFHNVTYYKGHVLLLTLCIESMPIVQYRVFPVFVYMYLFI